MRNALLLICLLLGLLCIQRAYSGPGAIDPSFTATANGPVYCSAIQSDGRIYVGGTFTSINNLSRTRIARLYSDGTLDTGFLSTATVSGTIWTMALQPDGKLVIGGDFTLVNGATRNRLARFNLDGSLDGTFNPLGGPNATVYAIALQPDGKMLIGGAFMTVNATNRSYLARINVDGSLDATFNTSTGINGVVRTVGVQSDGKIVIGGDFTTVFGLSRNRFSRMNIDGNIDQNFLNGLTGANAIVRSLAIQSDGKILLGGDFSVVNGTARNRIARVNADGSLDATYASSAGANGSVYNVQTNSSNVLLVGDFTSFNGSGRVRLAGTYADATLDPAVMNGLAGANYVVRTLSTQGDGKMLIGGDFTFLNTSNKPYLARLYGDLYPPEVVVQPQSRNTNTGANVTFSVIVSNPTPVSYQWRKDGVNLSGATSSTYSLSNVQPADSGSYSVFLSNGAGGTTSSNAVLNVGTPIIITAQPSSLVVTQGQSASFSVNASGTSPFYFWRKNGVFILGQTNKSFVIPSTTTADAAVYTCLVSNFFGGVSSAGATLSVNYAPTILTQPVSQTVGVGSNFTVSVTARGVPAIGYLWRKNGMDLAAANAPSYTVFNTQPGDAGAYDVVVTNIMGSITSSVANITVVYYPPSLSEQPVGGNVRVGDSLMLTATASGTAPLNWQWYQNGVALTNGAVITTNLAGDIISGYTNLSAQIADSGSYWVVVNNSAGSVTSSVAQVEVGYAPVITQQPFWQTNTVGGSATLSCTVTGTPPISLQWLLSGTPLPGATNGTLSLTNLQPASIGYYQVAVINDFGGVTSSNAALNLAGYDFGIWSGLVAYYPFNGNANDESGNGNNGMNNGAVLTVDRFGNPLSAYSFNGSDAFVHADAQFAAGAASKSYSVWCNADAFKRGWIIGGGSDSDSCSFGLCMEITGTGKTIFHGNSTAYDLPFGYVQTNSWYHLTATYDGVSLQCFINGVWVSSKPMVLNTASAGVTIGRRQNPDLEPIYSDSFFQGLIDDLRIYNRALSSNEIAQLYAMEADVPVIAHQPVSQTVIAGGSAILSVSATATHSLTYQWQKDGVIIPGATNNSLVFSYVQSSNVGFYSVNVSNGLVGVTSSSVLLNVVGYTDPIWKGLVAYYPFNGNARDEGGHRFDGSVIGASLTTNRFGNSNSAYYFDGISSEIDASATPSWPSGNNARTVSIWFLSSANRGMLYTFGDGVAFHSCFAVSWYETPSFITYYDDFDFSRPSAIGWMQLAVTYDGTIGILYFNGKRWDSFEKTGLNTVGTSPLLIGAGAPSFPKPADGYFMGVLDDMRIYDRALSSDEVAYLYQMESQATLVPPQLLAVAPEIGSVGLQFMGLPGRSYILESATNLISPVHWTPVVTNLADLNGTWNFTDTNLNTTQKFYRTVMP